MKRKRERKRRKKNDKKEKKGRKEEQDRGMVEHEGAAVWPCNYEETRADEKESERERERRKEDEEGDESRSKGWRGDLLRDRKRKRNRTL